MSQGDILMARKAMRQRVEPPPAPNPPSLPQIHTGSTRSRNLNGSTKAGTHLTSAHLVPPASGSMEGRDAPIVSPVIRQREEQAKKVITDREVQQVQYEDDSSEYRRQQLLILREKERMGLRQRTAARLALQARSRQTSDELNDDEVHHETAAAAAREARKVIPQETFVETNRTRMEVAMIRRNEERDALKRRSEYRRHLESTVGTSFAQSQTKLQSTIGSASGGLAPTAEDAFRCEMEGREEKWRDEEEKRDIRRAMAELNALDERLEAEEAGRREERRTRKEKLREDSRRRDGAPM